MELSSTHPLHQVKASINQLSHKKKQEPQLKHEHHCSNYLGYDETELDYWLFYPLSTSNVEFDAIDTIQNKHNDDRENLNVNPETKELIDTATVSGAITAFASAGILLLITLIIGSLLNFS